MKRRSLAVVMLAFCAAHISSCSTAPTACFNVVTPSDSIRVGHTVTFNSACSADASHIYWDFGNGTSSYLSPNTTTTYDTLGTYNVSLVVSGSGKTASTTQSVIVKP